MADIAEQDILVSALGNRSYLQWQRHAEFRRQIDAMTGGQVGTIDRQILTPYDRAYRFMQESVVGGLLASPGNSLIGHSEDSIHTVDYNLTNALEVKIMPDYAFVRIHVSYAEPDQNNPDAPLWNCSVGAVFEYDYPDGSKGQQETGVALLSNGQRGSYVLCNGFAPSGELVYESSAAFTISARHFDAFIKSAKTLHNLTQEERLAHEPRGAYK